KGARRDDGEPVAQGLLGDLLDHEPREIHRRTGLVIERGGLGTWLVGEAGAILLPGGRRAHCFCVRAKGDDLPPSDRVAHLLLPGAAAGTLEPRHVVVPLREELERTEIRVGRVTGADPATQTLMYQTPDGRADTLEWDQLVVALGSISRVVPVPGLAEHGLGFKTLSEAIALRNRALLNLEVAESLDDPEARRSWLTFVFVGAGYAGLEGIAEMQDYIGDVIERYPRSKLDGTRWVLVEAGERI